MQLPHKMILYYYGVLPVCPLNLEFGEVKTSTVHPLKQRCRTPFSFGA